MIRSTISPLRTVAALLYVPLFMMIGGGTIVLLAPSRSQMIPVVLGVVIVVSFGAEHLAPYQPDWNRDRGDRVRDIAHAFVNEVSTAISVAALPVLAQVTPNLSRWPDQLPFSLQVLLAVVVLDAGITIVHRLSHRWNWLWRFHAVHHSVRRLYGFNGLVKHPVHQAIETGVGMAPLVALGVPRDVGVALAGLVVLQLLLQHSNVDYRVGGLRRWLALNQGHRLHHVGRVPEGDVNFGLFLLIWDRLLGTYKDPTDRNVDDGELGIAGRPDYPVRYVEQLAMPFRDVVPI